MLRRTPLARGGPLKRQSATRKAGASTQRGAPGPLGFGDCFSCGCWRALDRSHILPQGMNQLLRFHPDNIVGECRECHTLWGEKLAEYARCHPEALAAKVARMELLNRERWALWMLKNSHLLP